ncbi:MAG: T9SS type A sorting domain-containing protein [Bacteroidia bacterium]|nr:T9SS type A sorting domain-containing protein [Bacteroidia bacterium]
MKINLRVPVLLFLFLFAFGGLKAAQLSGSYTINPAGTATTTNFKDIRSAVTFMTSTSARNDGGPANSGTVGVNGPVTFWISAGTYTEQITIPAITGASTTNTVTFRGAGRSNTTLTFATSDANNRHTLKFNLATNVTFRDMSIVGTGSTHAWVVHIMGLNANNNRIKNCSIRITGTGATSTSSNYIAVVINNSATAATTGTRVDGTEIDSNSIDAGYYGIVAAGASSNLHVGLRITNNRITNSYLYGVYGNYINGIHVNNNFIFPRVSYQYNYGLYLTNSTCTGVNRHIITNNRIHGFGYYGIYIVSSNNLTGNKGFIFNNMVGGLMKYDYSRCLFLSSSSQYAISHNSFHKDISGYNNTYGAVYISGGTGISFRNNICSEKMVSQALPLYASAASIFDTLDFNVFYRPDTSNGSLIYVGSNLNSGNFKGALGFNTFSTYGNPGFVNDTLFLTNNPCFQGTPISYITSDYFGNSRSATNPVIGAFEKTAITNNLALVRVSSLTPPVSAGAQDFNVFLRNNGSNAITSFSVSYIHNNGTPQVYNWLGTLAPCDTVTVSFTGSQQPTIGAINNFKVYSGLPNAVVDADRSDDTLMFDVYLPLSGTYQIGGSNPDFAKPSDAFNALQAAGMTGPVRFEVNPGTYSDRISIENSIMGASATNTITLVGKNRNTCIIQNSNATTSERHTIKIGASYLRIDSLTIRAANPNFGWGIHISKTGLRAIQIKNCTVDISSSTAATSSSDVFMGIVMSGANNSAYYYDTYVLDSIEVDSNTIINGYSGISQYSYFYSYYYTYGAPSEAIKIRNNTIINPYYVGIMTAGTSSLDVSNNFVRMRKENTSSYGLQIQSHDATTSSGDMLVVSGNRIIDAGYMGLYLYNTKANANNRGRVENNAVTVGYQYANPYGMYIYGTSNTNFYHNSVLNTYLGTSNTTGALYFVSNTGARMRNNHFVVSKAGSLSTPGYFSGNTFTSAAEFNYNNFYRPDTSGTFVYINSWFSGRGFVGALGSNLNSIVQDPRFVSDTLLLSKNACLNGDSLSSVPMDITGVQRNALPDLGAYEVKTVIDDAAPLQVLEPVAPIQPGSQDVRIRFANYGANTLNSVTVGYIFNNGVPVSQVWTGSLATCDTSSVVFSGTGQITIASGTVNTMKIFTSGPNSSLDSNLTNDTVLLILPTPMKGTYIVGPAPSDFLTIADAANALALRGVDSIVNIKIKTGTYSEQFILPAIVGASEQNRITFSSLANHVDSVIIQYNSTLVGDNYVVKLTGARYVDFNRLSLRALGTSYGYVFDIGMSSGYTSIRECKLTANIVTTTSTNMALVYAMSNTGGNVSFVRNTFTGGSYAIYFRGTATNNLSNVNIIDSNTFLNQYYMGVYLYYMANQTFRNNVLSTTSAYTTFYGLYAYYVDSTFEVTRNSISTTTANGYGIFTNYCDAFAGKYMLVANNIVRIGSGSSTACFGIRDSYSGGCVIANNTSVINTTSTSGYAGYFYYTSTVSSSNKIRNNVFVNLTSGACLYHYNPLYGSSDYNVIFTSGTANWVQRGTPANTYTSLQAFKSAVTNFEQNSLQYRPGLLSGTNLAPNPADTASWSLNGRAQHLSDVQVDYLGNPRPQTYADGIPDIGAYEFNPTSTPPLCTAVPAVPVAGGTQVFLFGSDTVCKVVHDASSTPPSSLLVRQYSGRVPPFTSPIDARFNSYVSLTAPSGFYLFDMYYYYKDNWIGSTPSESVAKLAQNSPNSPWVTYGGFSSTVDSNQNFLYAPFMNTYSVFTGTDGNNPLPVDLNSFKGYVSDADAVLMWQTASEENSSHFELERAFDGVSFAQVGKLAAAGNSKSLRNYLLVDQGVFANQHFAYYRLKMVDRDGSFEYSNTIRLSKAEQEIDLAVGPNPFKNSFTIQHVKGLQQVELVDLGGRLVFSTEVAADGEAKVQVPAGLQAGVYFVKLTNSGNTRVFKVVKE